MIRAHLYTLAVLPPGTLFSMLPSEWHEEKGGGLFVLRGFYDCAAGMADTLVFQRLVPLAKQDLDPKSRERITFPLFEDIFEGPEFLVYEDSDITVLRSAIDVLHGAAP